MKKLIEIPWKDLQVGDVLAEHGEVVKEIFPWQIVPCYEVLTVLEETGEDGEDLSRTAKTVVSEDHLIAVETFNVFGGKGFERTETSKQQTHKESENWISVADAYQFFMNEEAGICKVPGLLGELEIRPYKNLEPQRCRCIQTDQDHFVLDGVMYGNSARGEHDIMSMKDIVADLSRSGLSDQWISRNLFLDIEAITRFKQLSGMKAAFNDASGYTEDAWDPIRDQVAERRKNINLTRAATRYVRKYRQLRGLDSHFDEQTDVLEAARNLGWDPSRPNELPKSLDEQGRVFEKEIAGDAEADSETVVAESAVVAGEEKAPEAAVPAEPAPEPAVVAPAEKPAVENTASTNASIAETVVRDFGTGAEQTDTAAAASAIDAILEDDDF